MFTQCKISTQILVGTKRKSLRSTSQRISCQRKNFYVVCHFYVDLNLHASKKISTQCKQFMYIQFGAERNLFQGTSGIMSCQQDNFHIVYNFLIDLSWRQMNEILGASGIISHRQILKFKYGFEIPGSSESIRIHEDTNFLFARVTFTSEPSKWKQDESADILKTFCPAP